MTLISRIVLRNPQKCDHDAYNGACVWSSDFSDGIPSYVSGSAVLEKSWCDDLSSLEA